MRSVSEGVTSNMGVNTNKGVKSNKGVNSNKGQLGLRPSLLKKGWSKGAKKGVKSNEGVNCIQVIWAFGPDFFENGLV